MLDWLYPQTIETVRSKFNGTIRVDKTRGKFSVWVGGFEQSGPLVSALWKKALDNTTTRQCNHILILGLGCGEVARLVTQKWPKAKVQGVEIDPVIIRVGKKYFNHDQFPNLKIIQKDALQYVTVLKQKFDLIVVDLYIGGNFLKKTVVDKFLVDCQNKLRKTSQIIFNQLTFKKSAEDLQDFKINLKKYFLLQKEIKTEYNNILVCVRK